MDFGDILRGVGGFAANELLGIDDFRRAYNYAKQGQYGKALKSAGAGAFELGSTVIPAGGILKGAKLGKGITTSSRFAGPLLSRIPGFANEAGMLTKAGSGALKGFRAGETGQNLYFLGDFARGLASPTQQPLVASPLSPTSAKTGITNGYTVTPYGAMPTTPAKAATTDSGSTTGTTAPAGASGTAGTTAPTPTAPEGGLAAMDPAVKAALDAETAAAEEALQTYINTLGLERRRGSTAEEEALREAARIAGGGAVDVAGLLGESGFGPSPAVLGVALEQLRGQEAAARRNILGRRTGRLAEAGQREEVARRNYELALQNIRNRGLANRVGQTISMIQPYLGGA